MSVPTVHRYMKQLGLNSIIKRKYRNGSKSKTFAKNLRKNILKQDFKTTGANQKWSTDITYLQCANGTRLYLSSIKDMYDKSIISYSISNHNDLVLNTFKPVLSKFSDSKTIV